MKNYYLIALSMVLLVVLPENAGSAVATRAVQSDYRGRIGVAERNKKNGFCINIDDVLAPGTKVSVVWAYGRQAINRAVLGKALPGGCAMHADSARYSYVLTKTGGALPDTAIGIAIINPPTRYRIKRGRAEIDIDGDGQPEQFRICTSSEGLHLTVWTGVPLSGSKRWHQYYSAGYDLVPGCTAKDFKDP